jgi:SpoVK/Ycf46/Vps4 family AAA+-type ATPase
VTADAKSIAERNVDGDGVDVARVQPFRSPEEHLRAELWRIWLRVEHELRRRWELSALPPTQQEGSLGVWQPREIGGLFKHAHAEYAGATTETVDHGAREVMDAYMRHSALLETRIERTLAGGGRLPLMELVRVFALDPRQRATLTLALAAEIDATLPVVLRYLTNDPAVRHVTGQVLAMLVYDSVRARSRMARDLSPRSPLVAYRLLELDESVARHDSILHRRIRPAARLLPLLDGGMAELDPELDGLARLIRSDEPGLFSDELTEMATRALSGGPVLVVAQGQRGIGKRTLFATAAAANQRSILAISAGALAGRPAQATSGLLGAIVREARLHDAVPVLVDLDEAYGDGPVSEPPPMLPALCAMWDGPIGVTVAGDRVPHLRMRPVAHLALSIPSLGDRVELGQRALPELAGDDAEALAQRYAVTGGVIEMAARAASATATEPTPTPEALDAAVRDQLFGRLQRLGTRLATPYTFDDIVADDDTLAALYEVVSAISERRRVPADWGLRGAAGISVLFSGSPGVGKTMSATVIAQALGLAIYEIDLSQVMSKWIGETEKNLAEVFDAAEPGHVVLLFNEADSLFGKRTAQVQSANDRFANLGTNYLLQRLERFDGVAILTTNLSNAIDQAFRRRFAYDVQFAFPSREIRTELWRRALPQQAHGGAIEHAKLAERFELSGGYIKVAVQRAALIASGRRSLITTEILVETIERMYRERGKLSAVGRLE